MTWPNPGHHRLRTPGSRRPRRHRPAERAAQARGPADRKPMSIWDRIKFLILLVLVWFILVWSAMANNPLIGFSDAMRIQYVRAGGCSC